MNNKRKIKTISLITCLIALLSMKVSAEILSFASPFSDNAVLQREMQTPVWGKAEPGATVEFNVKKDNKVAFKAKTKADSEGNWLIETKPFKAGGPYTVTIKSSGSEDVTISNVLFGDLWVCSGQSNMEMSYGWGLTRGKEDIEQDTYDDIRLLHVPNRTSAVPTLDFASNWKICNPEAAKRFTACGYFFGAALKKELPDVPIGLVDSTWSGTYIQTWLSLDSLAKVPEVAEVALDRKVAVENWFNGNAAEEYEEALKQWEATLDMFANAEIKPFEDSFDDSDWQRTAMPNNFNTHAGADFDGVVWYRFNVELTGEQAGSEAVLTLGAIDDEDVTYVNARKVGGLTRHNEFRKYSLPAGTLKEGSNLIAIRVTDTGQTGGLTGKADDVALIIGEEKILLGGDWAYHVNRVDFVKKPERFDQVAANSYSACYNGMMVPLFPLAVKGAIWYQGCSNVGGEALYTKFFEAMAEDWRENLKGGDFPIYLVQLAPFMQTHKEPYNSAWARMRWTMTQIGENVKNSGTAIILDAGDHHDIHPKDKKTVGERLARLALNRTYGRKDIVETGPYPTGVVKTDNGLEVSFKYADSLKTTDGGGDVIGFQVVDADGKASWAKASLANNKVIVETPKDVEVVAVRHAWDDYPVYNLLNGADIPCGPFQVSVE